jgi:hypothetical protein
MARAVIGFPRWTTQVTWSGGAWTAGYPVGNLSVLPLARVARSVDLLASSTQFIGTFPKKLGLRLLALVRHNLTLNAKYRLTIFADAARTTQIYDTGWQKVFKPVYAYDQLEWEYDNWWTGQYDAPEFTGYLWHTPIWLPKIYLCSAFQIEITDPTNPAGYIDIGMCEVAQAWQVTANPSPGVEIGFRSRTIMTEAAGGVKYPQRRDKPRTFSGTIEYIMEDEAKSRAFEAQRQLDLDTPFFWLWDADATTHLVRDSYLARQSDLRPLSYQRGGGFNVSLNLEEVL